jgi:hypothetical protein
MSKITPSLTALAQGSSLPHAYYILVSINFVELSLKLLQNSGNIFRTPNDQSGTLARRASEGIPRRTGKNSAISLAYIEHPRWRNGLVPVRSSLKFGDRQRFPVQSAHEDTLRSLMISLDEECSRPLTS